MRTFDLQGIELDVSPDAAYSFVADPGRLPEWTSAFARTGGGRTLMRTPAGEVDVDLTVAADRARGTVDWHMTFPDGAVADAYSRIVPLGPARCIFSFVLLAPPVPLEELEGSLEQQARTLREELRRLKDCLEHA